MLAPLNAARSIAVRCPNWVGDVVMATPVFECLRSNLPNHRIIGCVRPSARRILEDSPWFDEIVDCQDKSLSGLRALRRELRPYRPEVGILLTNTTHSWLTFKFAGIPKVYGYRRNLRRRFLTGGPKPVVDDGKITAIPMQEYYLELCRFLGLDLPVSPKPGLYFSPAVEQQARDLLASYNVGDEARVIGINPGASFGSSKCWPAEYFSQLAELLQERFDCRLLLLAGPGEADLADRIVANSKAPIINTARDHVDLALLKPLIKRCDLLITNDTGPRHYAVAFDVPCIVLMGPTNPVFTATNLEHTTVLRRELPCAPCHKKTCPLGHHACMREITPQMVLEKAVYSLYGAPA